MSVFRRIGCCALVVLGFAAAIPVTAQAVFSYGYVNYPYWSSNYSGSYGQSVGIQPQGAYPGHPYGVAGYGENNYWFVQSGAGTQHISGGFVSSGAGVSTPCGFSGSPARFMEWQNSYGVTGCIMGGVGTAGVDEQFAQWCQSNGTTQFQNGYWYGLSGGWPYLLGPIYIGGMTAMQIGGQTSNGLATPPHLTDAAAYMSIRRKFTMYNDCGMQRPFNFTDGQYRLNVPALITYHYNSNWWVPAFSPTAGWGVGTYAF